MSFSDDAADADFRRDPYFVRPAATIVVSAEGEPIETIQLPELKLTRDQCSPEWLALQEAERHPEDVHAQTVALLISRGFKLGDSPTPVADELARLDALEKLVER